MASILTGAEVRGSIPGGVRTWSREAQRCESAVEMRGTEKDSVYTEPSWAGGNNDGNKNNNNSNDSKHMCSADSMLRHCSTHFMYISTFNPHNQSVKTVLLLSHFIDEEAEAERSQ